MVNIYRAYKGIPTRTSDKLRTVHTVAEAEGFYGTYEGQGMAIAVYEADASNPGTENLVYSTPGV